MTGSVSTICFVNIPATAHTAAPAHQDTRRPDDKLSRPRIYRQKAAI